MSATSTAPLAGATALPGLRPSLKVPVSLGVLALIALVFFGLLGPDQTAEMKISDPGDAFAVPALAIPGRRWHRPGHRAPGHGRLLDLPVDTG